jgi:indolepyruvate ferredoxin oxidoreductase alpha subunit
MGASIGMAHGFEKARGVEFASKSVAVIGDSTFSHSGITGLLDIVYNKGATTVIILDNSITAMTGHQDNPSTGYTLKGEQTPALDFEALGSALGIQRIQTVDAYDLETLEQILKEETAAKEPSLIITKRPCVLIKRDKKVAKPLIINQEACKGCKACLKIGCPAISFKDGKAKINPAICVGCGLCTQICKFGAIGGETV